MRRLPEQEIKDYLQRIWLRQNTSGPDLAYPADSRCETFRDYADGSYRQLSGADN